MLCFSISHLKCWPVTFPGSLVVRLIFRPFEESNRLKFAEMASGFFLLQVELVLNLSKIINIIIIYLCLQSARIRLLYQII